MEEGDVDTDAVNDLTRTARMVLMNRSAAIGVFLGKFKEKLGPGIPNSFEIPLQLLEDRAGGVTKPNTERVLFGSTRLYVVDLVKQHPALYPNGTIDCFKNDCSGSMQMGRYLHQTGKCITPPLFSSTNDPLLTVLRPSDALAHQAAIACGSS